MIFSTTGGIVDVSPYSLVAETTRNNDLRRVPRQAVEKITSSENVKAAMEDVKLVMGRFGYEVTEIPIDPHAALVVCGRLWEEVNGAPGAPGELQSRILGIDGKNRHSERL